MSVAVFDLDAVGEVVIDMDGVGVPVLEAVRLAEGVLDGVLLGVGQGTVVISDIMAFMRRRTQLPKSLANNSPTSEMAMPTGLAHREAPPPVLVMYPEVVLPMTVATPGSITRRMTLL